MENIPSITVFEVALSLRLLQLHYPAKPFGMSIPLAMEVWLGDQSHEIRTKADLETALREVDNTVGRVVVVAYVVPSLIRIINKDKPVLFKYVICTSSAGAGVWDLC